MEKYGLEKMLNVNTVKIGNYEVGSGKLAVIAGPCIAESMEICLEIASVMHKLCKERGINYIFKASFDKANRSSGESFRGLGMAHGFDVLKEVKRQFQIPVLTDVHEAGQAAAVAEVADVLQIPAFLCRQTDLLTACGVTGKPVNVKKGQFMAPEDMKGAVKKLHLSGNYNVMLTERGASFGYHNLVVDMRGLQTMRAFEVPVIFDATHSVQLPGGLGNSSGGQRQFIGALSRAAAAVGIDGIFMEVHPNPQEALSDGPNSLDFAGAERTLDEVSAIYELTRKML